MADLLSDSEEYPDSHWIVEFMKFDQSTGRPIKGDLRVYEVIAFNAKSALEKGVDAMTEASPPENAHHWRCVKLFMAEALDGGKEGRMP